MLVSRVGSETIYVRQLVLIVVTNYSFEDIVLAIQVEFPFTVTAVDVVLLRIV